MNLNKGVGRLHHFVKWDFAVPKILPYRYN